MSVTSQNGYIANDVTRTQSWTIPGTKRAVRLRKGSPGALLCHLAAWFDKNVEDIEAGQLDDWGYAERPIRGGTELSNHASGTAIDLNATKHPLGARNTYSAANMAKIRAHLKIYEGCIRWGGDYKNRADEMHFEIVRDVATCDRVWAELNKPTPPISKPPTGGTAKPPTPEDTMSAAEVQDLKNFIEKNNQKYAVAVNNYVRQVLGTATKAIIAASGDTDATAAVASLNAELDERDAKMLTDIQAIADKLDEPAEPTTPEA